MSERHRESNNITRASGGARINKAQAHANAGEKVHQNNNSMMTTGTNLRTNFCEMAMTENSNRARPH
jgi:hypothetical protein